MPRSCDRQLDAIAGSPERGRRSACPARCTWRRCRAGCRGAGRAAAGGRGPRPGRRVEVLARSPAAVVARPAAEVVGDARRRARSGWRSGRLGLGLGPGQEEERLDDLRGAGRPRRGPRRGSADSPRPSGRGGRATSSWPIRAVSGVRSWCEASPVNRFCRSSSWWSRSSRPLNEPASASSSSPVPGLGRRWSRSAAVIEPAAVGHPGRPAGGARRQQSPADERRQQPEAGREPDQASAPRCAGRPRPAPTTSPAARTATAGPAAGRTRSRGRARSSSLLAILVGDVAGGPEPPDDQPPAAAVAVGERAWMWPQSGAESPRSPPRSSAPRSQQRSSDPAPAVEDRPADRVVLGMLAGDRAAGAPGFHSTSPESIDRLRRAGRAPLSAARRGRAGSASAPAGRASTENPARTSARAARKNAGQAGRQAHRVLPRCASGGSPRR